MPDRTESWAERTVEVPPEYQAPDPSWPQTAPLHVAPPSPAYNRGVAQVGASSTPALETTQEYNGSAPSWDAAAESGPRPPVSYQLRQLRKGGEWTWAGGLFAFICWGVWTVSTRGGDFMVPALAFVLVLLVALGVFALSRVLGRLILERMLGRVRHSAVGAHVVTALFLAAAGVAYLGQTEWVVDAWNWVRGLGG